ARCRRFMAIDLKPLILGPRGERKQTTPKHRHDETSGQSTQAHRLAPTRRDRRHQSHSTTGRIRNAGPRFAGAALAQLTPPPVPRRNSRRSIPRVTAAVLLAATGSGDSPDTCACAASIAIPKGGVSVTLTVATAPVPRLPRVQLSPLAVAAHCQPGAAISATTV